MAVAPGSHSGTRFEHWRVTTRAIQVALGGLWLLDGLLQLQPKMFTRYLVNGVMRANAAGQPHWLGAAITHLGNFVSRDVALWNLLLALTQIAIGLGIISRRFRTRALGVSIVWAGFVWVFGEGLGGLLTGSASPLMGAPGAVALYALIAVMVWPTEQPRPTDGRLAVASAPAAGGPLGGLGALGAWAGVWGLLALLFVLPDNRHPNVIRQNILMMAVGEPHPYAHFLASLAHAFSGAGAWVSVFLAACCLVTALGPFLSRSPRTFLVLGSGLSLVFWATGQALGGLLGGGATDPNTGPLLVLLALALAPAVAPSRAGETVAPAALLLERRARLASGAIGAALVLPVLVAAIPVPAAAGVAAGRSQGSLESAMPGMGGSSAIAGSSASGHASPRKMNMAGMGGLGVTAPNWHYTGPPLPSGEASLLTTVSEDQDRGHSMQTPDCMTPPTANQVLGATEYVQAVSAAVAKYQYLSVALKAGYIPITSTAYPVVHYVNPAYMQQRYVLDPNHVDSLVYAFTPDGPVLVAAMFLLPTTNEKGPMPYGCLVQWHAHTNLCFSDTSHVIVGFTPCAPGTYNARTPYMTHVWQVPVPGGPLAIDPSDLVVMEAAMQAQQEGLAPITLAGRAPYYKSSSLGQVGTF
ncbi:MAG TPA: hypothetical protein VKU92_07020 [Acidimicrobiales bacterium]|nr:hypothetical protein [Acidimicrobiales bacterium]